MQLVHKFDQIALLNNAIVAIQPHDALNVLSNEAIIIHVEMLKCLEILQIISLINSNIVIVTPG